MAAKRIHRVLCMVAAAVVVVWWPEAIRAEGKVATRRPPAAGSWLVRPAQTEPKIREWAREHARYVSLDSIKTLGGHRAYAVTVTDGQIDATDKKRLLFSQPHAHEPAATAGMMDFLSQLLDGRHLDGRPARLDRARILRQAVVTFIPDGNPDGRARAPADWWDGRKYANEDFLCLAFGRTREGRRFPRQGRWSTESQQPASIGFAYEKISEHEYVEPNRDRESTFFKLVLQTLDKGPLALHVDLHQTEFSGSQHNTMVMLPFLQADLPPEIRDMNRRTAEAIIRAWRATGANPVPKARPYPTREDQRRYFRKCWSDIYRKVPQVVVEVQNNNERTPPVAQMELIETAIVTAVEVALASGTEGSASNPHFRTRDP